MLIRIVKMTFQEEQIAAFLEIFQGSKLKIRTFEGCQHLELLQDASQKHIFYTYSHWQSEEHLERYRHSELFTEVWARTKALFAQKAQASSMYRHIEVLPGGTSA